MQNIWDLLAKILHCVCYHLPDHERLLTSKSQMFVNQCFLVSFFFQNMILQLAKKKHHEELIPWIGPIRNHFWYCCKECNGSELKLKLLWTRLLHHICNDHDYCKHSPIEDEQDSKNYLSSNGSTMKELRKIVNDPRWLKSLASYTRNRHTGMIEVFEAGLFPIFKHEIIRELFWVTINVQYCQHWKCKLLDF